MALCTAPSSVDLSGEPMTQLPRFESGNYSRGSGRFLVRGAPLLLCVTLTGCSLIVPRSEDFRVAAPDAGPVDASADAGPDDAMQTPGVRSSAGVSARTPGATVATARPLAPLRPTVPRPASRPSVASPAVLATTRCLVPVRPAWRRVRSRRCRPRRRPRAGRLSDGS